MSFDSPPYREFFYGYQSDQILTRLDELENDRTVCAFDVFVNGGCLPARVRESWEFCRDDEVVITWWEYSDAITLLGNLARD